MKRKILIFSLFIIIICISILLYKNYKNNKKIELETKEINLFFDSFNNQNEVIKSEYIMVLEIPKINLKKGLYNLNTKYNDVSYNIEILLDSDMPNIKNGNLILASHSGNSNVSYFTNLDKLNINDKVYIYYNKIKYEYLIKNIYEIDKTGKAEIIRNKNINTLTMITCDEIDKTKQVIYISEINKDE